jgi:hypothetical protein
MANIGLADEELIFEYDSRRQHLNYLRGQAWSLPMAQQQQQPQPQQQQQQSASQNMDLRREMQRLQTTHQNAYHQPALPEQHLMTDWGYQPPPPQYSYPQHAQSGLPFSGVYGVSMQSSPVDIMPVSQAPMETGLALDPQYMAPQQSLEAAIPFHWHELQAGLASFTAAEGALNVPSCQQAQSTSPSDTHLEVRSLTSLSDSDGWNAIEARQPYDRNGCVDPSETLHNRTSSESSWSSDFEQQPRNSFISGFELVPHAVHSPSSDSSPEFDYRYPPTQQHPMDNASQSSLHVSPVALVRPIPVPLRKPASKPPSPTRSPGSQGPSSPTSRRPAKKSPIAKATEKVIKKAPLISKPETEKRVGKRKGPLRPEQRKQASEIRKLRACLRCKFLKKTCDKGEPCTGCQPSHARLWQVPCTRIDIKEIGFFTKDYRADYARHLTFELSAGNIKGFSDSHKTLFISHGYGQMLPITVREVFVRDEKMFDIDWAETNNYSLDPKTYVFRTAPLYADLDCLSSAMMSDYLDRHLDVPDSFHNFVDSYCGETPFLTSMLKTAFNYYSRTKAPVIRKALKFLLAYSLTLHITLVEGIPDEEHFPGRVDDETSQYYRKIVAPNAINFQVKTSMGNMWRDLQKEVLEELSSLYSSVYSGDKLKHWPTIFILATLLLAVWEFMQFDAHRVPNDALMEKFLNDMETVPVGVVVGLFQAISQKLPSFVEWDTSKHHHVLQSNDAACKTMTEVRENVTRYGKLELSLPRGVLADIDVEQYLRSRAMSAKYDPEDFDSLSNKLISKLVIRAN